MEIQNRILVIETLPDSSMLSPVAGGFSDNFSCKDKEIEFPFLAERVSGFPRLPDLVFRGLGEEHQAGAGHRLGDLVIETELDIEFRRVIEPELDIGFRKPVARPAACPPCNRSVTRICCRECRW